MSRVNLLPSQIRKSQELRRRTLLIAAAAAFVIGLVLLLWIIQGMRLSQVNSDIEAQNQTNASLQQEISGLQQYADLQARAQQQEELLAAAYSDEMAYSGVLVDVSKVIPNDTYITSFGSAITPPVAGTTPTDTGTTFVGTMSFSGSTLHFESLSTWLTRLQEVQGWENPWMSNISQEGTTAGAYTFDTSVDLTQDALTERGRAGEAVVGG